MKISYFIGNVLEVTEPVIAHGCNARGVMGSGVALGIKTEYRKAFDIYEDEYHRYGLKLGQVIWANVKGKWIANCITQETFGRENKQYVDYDAVRQCMKTINSYCVLNNLKAVAMPLIGAGLGGGDWKVISKIIEEESTDFFPAVYVLTEDQLPESEATGFTFEYLNHVDPPPPAEELEKYLQTASFDYITEFDEDLAGLDDNVGC